MSQEVVIHVGPHKTGTTALQRMFVALRGMLAAEGVLYPKAGVMEVGHHLLAEHCRNRRSAFDRAAFRAEVADASRVLISSENFVLPKEEGLTSLRDMFPDARIRVVYYLRRLGDLWPSHWQELVKHGQVISFPEYVTQAAMGRAETETGAVNQIEQLSKLANVFGHDSLEIIGYDWLRAEGQEIGAHFLCTVLGIEKLAETKGAPVVNLSLKPWEVELFRLMNALREVRGVPASGALRDRVLARVWSRPPSWWKEFRRAVEAARTVELDSAGPLIECLQRRIVERFGSAFVGDREAVASAYLEHIRVRVPQFELPLVLSVPLRSEMEGFLVSIIEGME